MMGGVKKRQAKSVAWLMIFSFTSQLFADEAKPKTAQQILIENLLKESEQSENRRQQLLRQSLDRLSSSSTFPQNSPSAAGSSSRATDGSVNLTSGLRKENSVKSSADLYVPQLPKTLPPQVPSSNGGGAGSDPPANPVAIRPTKKTPVNVMTGSGMKSGTDGEVVPMDFWIPVCFIWDENAWDEETVNSVVQANVDLYGSCGIALEAHVFKVRDVPDNAETMSQWSKIACPKSEFPDAKGTAVQVLNKTDWLSDAMCKEEAEPKNGKPDPEASQENPKWKFKVAGCAEVGNGASGQSFEPAKPKKGDKAAGADKKLQAGGKDGPAFSTVDRDQGAGVSCHELGHNVGGPGYGGNFLLNDGQTAADTAGERSGTSVGLGLEAYDMGGSGGGGKPATGEGNVSGTNKCEFSNPAVGCASLKGGSTYDPQKTRAWIKGRKEPFKYTAKNSKLKYLAEQRSFFDQDAPQVAASKPGRTGHSPKAGSMKDIARYGKTEDLAIDKPAQGQGHPGEGKSPGNGKLEAGAVTGGGKTSGEPKVLTSRKDSKFYTSQNENNVTVGEAKGPGDVKVGSVTTPNGPGSNNEITVGSAGNGNGSRLNSFTKTDNLTKNNVSSGGTTVSAGGSNGVSNGSASNSLVSQAVSNSTGRSPASASGATNDNKSAGVDGRSDMAESGGGAVKRTGTSSGLKREPLSRKSPEESDETNVLENARGRKSSGRSSRIQLNTKPLR